jgi:hypothetical protein
VQVGIGEVKRAKYTGRADQEDMQMCRYRNRKRTDTRHNVLQGNRDVNKIYLENQSIVLWMLSP